MDIVLRALAVVSVAAAVIIAGRLIGPEMAGFVAVIPIGWMSMAVVLYARAGRHATSAGMAYGIGGNFGFFLAVAGLPLPSV